MNRVKLAIAMFFFCTDLLTSLRSRCAMFHSVRLYVENLVKGGLVVILLIL